MVKPGKRSGPRRKHYAAILFFHTPYSPFPVPYSLFPIVRHGPLGTLCCHAHRPARPTPENVPTGREGPQIGQPRDGHKVCHLTGSKKEFFKK